VIEHSMARNQHGEPVFKMRITSETDIFRWAFTLLHQQVEFMQVGAEVLRKQRRRMGATAWDEMDQHLTGGRAKQYAVRGGDV